MTAEVVIMNRGAVALAADSAVTFQGGKIFNSANKLHMLAPTYPVGILLYNNTALMGVPWEVIIKLFRNYLIENNKRCSRLVDYPQELITFLEANCKMLFPDNAQEETFVFLLESYMQDQITKYVNQEVERLIIQTTAPVLGHTILKIARDRIEEIYQEWDTTADLFDKPKSDEIAKKLKQKYFQLFEKYYAKYLIGLGLDASDKQKIWQQCVNWYLKARFFNSLHSGISFSGYGDDELYPSTTHYRFESYICDNLKFQPVETYLGETTAGVFALAQRDIVQTVIQGMHPNSWKYLEVIFQKEMEERLKQIVAPNQASQVKSMVTQDFTKIKAALEAAMRNQYTESILEIVKSLPKDELALMAETLINITSYMRRVSRDAETVGGLTDVAVISRKDGFIWIKRKHYFDADRNYHFFDDTRVTNESPILLQELTSIMKDIKTELQRRGKNDQKKDN